MVSIVFALMVAQCVDGAYITEMRCTMQRGKEIKMAFTTGVSHLPFANPPHFKAWTSTDFGATLVPVVDDRTGEAAKFETREEARRALRALLKSPAAQKRLAA